MTAYEVAVYAHHIECGVVDSMYGKPDNLKDKYSFEAVGEAIDRAYVLGLMIDAMPVELAEREI